MVPGFLRLQWLEWLPGWGGLDQRVKQGECWEWGHSWGKESGPRGEGGVVVVRGEAGS